MDNPQHNLLGVDWFGLVMGLGFVPFGYWCTDFLVIQRAMAANSMASARRVPLIASVPKMLFPFLVILPGLLALALILTKPRREEELKGLVYALTEKAHETGGRWFMRPVPVGICVLILTLILNLIFR